MQRTLKAILATAVAGCSAVVLAVGPATAPAHATPSVGVDSVVASVINNPNRNGPLAAFNLAAVSGAHGENPTGSFVIKSFGDFPFGGQYGAVVTCVKVSGGLATVVGRITWSLFSPRQVGTYTRVRLEDTGPFQDSTDKIQFGPYTGDPNTCPDPATPDREPITFGVVAVLDAP